MIQVVLVIHLMVAVALIGVILMQKSEGGALGIGGGGGMSNFMTGRGTANVLTRTTAILAACFMLTSVLLVIIPRLGTQAPSIIPETSTTVPLPTPTPTAPAAPATPPGPTVPSGQ
jgi:preprotein translocase subunit SecG